MATNSNGNNKKTQHEGVSFFKACTDQGSQGLVLDIDTLNRMSPADIESLQQEELDLFLWIRNQQFEGLADIHIGGNPEKEFAGANPLLDTPHVLLCRELLEMLNSKIIPDPKMF